MYDESREYDNKWQLACDSQVEKERRETTARVENETTARVKKVKKEMAESLLTDEGLSIERVAKLVKLPVTTVGKIRDTMAMAITKA